MSGSSATAAEADDLPFDCRPAKEGDTLVFDYSITNTAPIPLYVMDAVPLADPVSGRPRVDPDSVSLWLDEEGTMRILRGVPPLPEGQDPLERIVPLAVRLAPGEKLERRIAQRLPLAEHSPYMPEGHLRDYRLVPILGVAVAVDVITADAPGFVAAKAAGYPPGYFRLVPDEDVLLLRRLVRAFRTKGLHALIHRGDYPRPA